MNNKTSRGTTSMNPYHMDWTHTISFSRIWYNIYWTQRRTIYNEFIPHFPTHHNVVVHVVPMLFMSLANYLKVTAAWQLGSASKHFKLQIPSLKIYGISIINLIKYKCYSYTTSSLGIAMDQCICTIHANLNVSESDISFWDIEMFPDRLWLVLTSLF